MFCLFFIGPETHAFISVRPMTYTYKSFCTTSPFCVDLLHEIVYKRFVDVSASPLEC